MPNKESLMPYYHFLISINFLYPLATTFISFYLGQGKTHLVLFSTISFQLLKIVLAYFLIFGSGWIPSLGLMGGAISTFIAQSGLCLLLFVVFLRSKQAEIYKSWSWRFKPKLFWHCIYPGLLRAIGAILIYLCWASIARLMSIRGGNYNLILSIGSTLFIFLPFLCDAICQAQTSVASQILGAQNQHLLGKAIRSGFFLALLTVVAFCIPLVIFPTFTFHYLFPKIVMDDAMISNLFLGVWASFSLYTFSYVPISIILAYKDTKFCLFMGFFNWVDGYLVMYIAIEIVNIAADQFWLVLSLMYVIINLFYCCRMKWLQSKTLDSPIQPSFIG
jgi:Na+-driven multidrug efflux pump